MNDKFPVIDLLAAATHTRYVEPLYYIIARYKTRSYCYAATHVGKGFCQEGFHLRANAAAGENSVNFRGAIRLSGGTCVSRRAAKHFSNPGYHPFEKIEGLDLF